MIVIIISGPENNFLFAEQLINGVIKGKQQMPSPLPHRFFTLIQNRDMFVTQNQSTSVFDDFICRWSGQRMVA